MLYINIKFKKKNAKKKKYLTTPLRGGYGAASPHLYSLLIYIL